MFVYTVNDYVRETFGEKLYKVVLDGGMTCPNRDGTLGTDGCIFCSAGGSGDFAEKRHTTVQEQIERAKNRIAAKTNARHFIAYYQSYTNTYAPIDYLEKLFSETIACDEVSVLSIATRPDCLGEDVVELLSRLNKIKPVWVELGLQTVHEDTAKYIRRGYDLACYDDAVKRLKEAGIYVVVHTILYLPGESFERMAQTVTYVADSGVDGIKLQLLHVLSGTELEKDYRLGKVALPTKEEYLNTVTDLIEFLPKNMAIHRLTGDGPKSILVAPLWTGNKKDVLNSLNALMRAKDTTQGRRRVNG